MIESPMSLFVWLNVISIISGFIAGNHNRLRMSFCHENKNEIEKSMMQFNANVHLYAYKRRYARSIKCSV